MARAPTQQQIWDEEHRAPKVLPQMDSVEVSSGVHLFYEWLARKQKFKDFTGIEMGCGKGRNSIWLAEQGIHMNAFDFSEFAIHEAKARAQKIGITEKVNFLVHDATLLWEFPDDAFDVGIDYFASTDIETFAGRTRARDEFRRVIKPGGLLLVYTLSTDDQFQREMWRVHLD